MGCRRFIIVVMAAALFFASPRARAVASADEQGALAAVKKFEDAIAQEDRLAILEMMDAPTIARTVFGDDAKPLSSEDLTSTGELLCRQLRRMLLEMPLARAFRNEAAASTISIKQNQKDCIT